MDVSTLNKPNKEQAPPRADNGEGPPVDAVNPKTSPYASEAEKAAARKSQRGPNWMVFNVILPLVILAVGGLAIFLFGEAQQQEKPAEDQSLAARVKRLPEVKTLPVRSLDAIGGRLNLQVDGEVVPYREVKIATEVSGQIVYKDPACEVGNYVTKGQLLIRVDSVDYQNEVERLTKQKEQDYQAIRELEQEMVNTKRLIEVANSEVELQQREIKRLKSLPSGYASQSELDQAQRSSLQSINNQVTLQNQLDLMRQRQTRLESAEQLADTQLQMALTNLKRTEIVSPVSGVVYREDAEINSFVQRGNVIVTIEDTDKAEVVVNLRTDQLYWVLDQNRSASGDGSAALADEVKMARNYQLPKTDATISYTVAGRDLETFEWKGSLERYDGIGFDPTSRTAPVRILVDEPQRYVVNTQTGERQSAATGPSALVRGMFVSVTLHIEPRKKLVIVPGVALKPGSPTNLLWKFEPDDSALPEPVVAAESSDPSNVTATPPETTSFSPEDWVVGRVEVLKSVRPVESVQIPGAEEQDGKAVLGVSGKPMYWICEVEDGQIEAGDRLIVSPLPSLEGRGQDGVRALKLEMPVVQKIVTEPAA